MNYKEIVTKAVIAKGKKNSTNKYTLETEEVPNTILGCWVINHTFNGTNLGNKVLVSGSFDINKELGIEIVGDTKIKVPVEELDDDYVELTDDEEVSKEIDKVDTDYLK